MLKPMPSPRGTNHAKLFVVAPNPTMAMDSAIGFSPKPNGSSTDNRDGIARDGDVDLNTLCQAGDVTALASALAEAFPGDLIALSNAITEASGTDGKGKFGGKVKTDDEDAMASDERASIAKIIADAQAFAKKKMARIAQDRAPISEGNFHRRYANSAARVGINNMGEK